MKKNIQKIIIVALTSLLFVSYSYAVTYSTWNPSDKDASISLTNGNLTTTTTSGTGWVIVRSTVSVSSGKWYWEYHNDSGAVYFGMEGIATSAANLASYGGSDAYGWSYYAAGGNKVNNASFTAYGATYIAGDTIGVALDMDNGKIYFSKNGTWQNSGDPVAGTGYAFSGLSGSMFATVSHNGTYVTAVTANFGSSAFTYSPPTGYNSGLYSGSVASAPSTLGFFRKFNLRGR